MTSKPTHKAATSDRLFRWGGFGIAVASFLAQIPLRLQSAINVFDEGLYLTLVTFTSPVRLPYRDLWTLYGPGPAIFGAPVTSVFGDGLLVIRLAEAITYVLLIAAIYLFTVRFVPWWLATALALTVSVLAAHPHHFAQTASVVLVGLIFIDRALTADNSSKNRDIVVGVVVLGFAFMGRYEFVLISVGLLALVWVILRWHGESGLARYVKWGLAGPTLFVVYLLVIVGWEVAEVNLVTYPLGAYPDLACRGMGTPWRGALSSLFAPVVHQRWWSGYDLMLGAGTYLPPVLALSLGCLAFRLRDNTRRLVIVSITALLVLFVWLEMRPRAGSFPTAVWPYIVAGAAVLLGSLRDLRWVTGTKIATASILIVTVWVSWPSGVIADWSSWPPYHPKYGFADLAETGLQDIEIWSTVAAEVQKHSDPNDPIFVALNRNTGHFANAPMYYWVAERPPGTRFIEFDPCLTDTEPIQSMMVQELADTDVVLLTTFFPQDAPPSGPSHVLDDYLMKHFAPSLQLKFPVLEPGAFQQEIHVLLRESEG